MHDGDTTNRTVERRKVETDMFSFQGEKKSLERKKEELLTEIARAKKEISRLESEVTEQKLAVANLDHRIAEADMEIDHLKKKMNAL